MGASGGGEKGKEVSGDTGAGLRAGNELGTTITLPPLQAHGAAAQSREQRGNDRLGWRGGEIMPFFGRRSKYQKTSWAGPSGYLRSIPNQIKKCF